MLKGPPSDRQEDESKKNRKKMRKLTLDEIPEKPAPPANDAPPSSGREQKTKEWVRELYDSE